MKAILTAITSLILLNGSAMAASGDYLYDSVQDILANTEGQSTEACLEETKSKAFKDIKDTSRGYANTTQKFFIMFGLTLNKVINLPVNQEMENLALYQKALAVCKSKTPKCSKMQMDKIEKMMNPLIWKVINNPEYKFGSSMEERVIALQILKQMRPTPNRSITVVKEVYKEVPVGSRSHHKAKEEKVKLKYTINLGEYLKPTGVVFQKAEWLANGRVDEVETIETHENFSKIYVDEISSKECKEHFNSIGQMYIDLSGEFYEALFPSFSNKQTVDSKPAPQVSGSDIIKTPPTDELSPQLSNDYSGSGSKVEVN